jgi:hypothetical protein
MLHNWPTMCNTNYYPVNGQTRQGFEALMNRIFAVLNRLQFS